MLDVEQRGQLAARVRADRDALADEVTRTFLQRHPEWLDRYGDRARRRCLEDACFHLDFLASALDAGAPESFGEYVAWAAGMLSSRNIDPVHLAENLRGIEDALRARFGGQVPALVSACFEAAAESCAHPSTASVSTARSPFLQALLLGQRQAAANIGTELVRTGSSVLDVYCDVLQPALYEVGALWERNAITVAHEHIATTTAQYVISQLYPLIVRTPARRGRAIITGVQGELHQVGATMVADALEADGWDVRFFGTNVPHEAVLAALEEQETRLLGVSAATLPSLSRVVELFSAIRSRFGGRHPALVIGGAAILRSPHLCRDLDATAGAKDLRASVAELRALAVATY